LGEGGVNKGTGLRLFPTQERLAQLEEKYEKEPNKGESGKVLALNTSEIKYYNYLFSMKQRIETYWDYPSSSVRNREQGRLSVDFTITRDGGVEGIKIVKSSSYPALDDAAITAIRLATPFSPFPPEFDLEKVNIHARFEYQIFSQFSH
ncbi:MAG TPA: energy transducer TonB, partial [Thermodesulfobacteriota bacterium]|nr:energy transducer TonB [Thermodesulfobacteriota bacterium]